MPARAPRSTRWRGVLAAVAAVGFFGTAVIAPFTMPDASADEAFYERINQEFIPAPADDPTIHVAVAPREEIPKVVEVAPQPVATTVPKYTGGGSPAEWMAAAGIPESDWGYVDAIISRESGWNPNATNASSGACGLAQALPCSKVPGNGYNPVDNLRWANSYAQTCVPSRMYCGWEGAYRFWQANHWW